MLTTPLLPPRRVTTIILCTALNECCWRRRGRRGRFSLSSIVPPLCERSLSLIYEGWHIMRASSFVIFHVSLSSLHRRSRHPLPLDITAFHFPPLLPIQCVPSLILPPVFPIISPSLLPQSLHAICPHHFNIPVLATLPSPAHPPPRLHLLRRVALRLYRPLPSSPTHTLSVTLSSTSISLLHLLSSPRSPSLPTTFRREDRIRRQCGASLVLRVRSALPISLGAVSASPCPFGMTGSVWEPSPVPFPFGGAMMCGVVAPLGAPGCGLVPVAHRVWLWGVALVAALGEM
ncbi:hypothetical protein C8J57DRAFT_1570384 [Mycena rebaudengoi]|nr:hypothetical protein C8J57DRAFT_1570384 [Mycena rebaudengoi]